ncbi:MAG: pyridoxal phosphate-dependent aminotransferase family protein [Candidatus Nealsonbacteria bacterium]|nr:pyridoxal phosphate-dependent aminotransferase family protein [Candidatus Nealsonbacteria bacterium]
MTTEFQERGCASPLDGWYRSKLGEKCTGLRKLGRGSIFGATIEERRTGTAQCRIGGKWFVNFGSAEVLGLDADPRVRKLAREFIDQWGTCCGASRVYQYPVLYDQLERRIVQTTNAEQAIAFNSVTTVHCGVLPSLTRTGNFTIIIDRHAHNSMWRAADICAARGSVVKQFPHNDIAEVSRLLQSTDGKLPIVVVDSVYSMSGDFAPIKELYALVNEHNGLLYVDDAHGTGLHGDHGGGYVTRELGRLPPNILVVGSLSKALCGYGGFLACGPEYREFVECAAEGFLFNGPIPAPMLGADLAVFDILLSHEYSSMRTALADRQQRVRSVLENAGFTIIAPASHIFAISMTEKKAVALAQHLFEAGVLVNLALFPAVPLKAGLIRLTPGLLHTDEDTRVLAAALQGFAKG